MPKFYNRDMADLAHQLTISPRRLRVEQIRGIEQLLALIDPERTYPFDFICYTITGFRKKRPTTSPSVPGKALTNDLVSLAEFITRKSSLSVSEIDEPTETHVDLAGQLDVSTKTIRRWRSRGLMGIRAVCDDGVNRLVFFRSTIDRFVKQNKDLVARGASFKQLTPVERDRIVERARELVSRRSLKLHTVARTIAEETGRAIETMRYTLRRYDDANPDTALFLGRRPSAYDERCLTIWRCHKAGESTASIARAFGCSAEEIEQVLREVLVRSWKETPLECIHNQLFDAPNADKIILDTPEPAAAPTGRLAIPKDLPPYLRALYQTPLLSAEQEVDLFRRYNYLKYKTARRIVALDPAEASVEQVDEVRALMDSIDSIRQRITRANLRLVVSIAKKHVGWSPNFFEVISDGNMSLMRAVEKFDYARGNKFSTYATWAIMKNYARSIPEQRYYGTRYVTGQETVLDNAADHRSAPAPQSDRKRVRELIAAALGSLTEREREIVSGHFGLAKRDGTLTLEQLGRRFGVTKERVRQIEQRALAQLRETLSPTLVDALAD
jgi:RNA polymerase sigma factor (sigma-70 family)